MRIEELPCQKCFPVYIILLASGSERAVPQTCDELADMISAMATATDTTERLSIVRDILQTPITKCTDASKPTQVPAYQWYQGYSKI